MVFYVSVYVGNLLLFLFFCVFIFPVTFLTVYSCQVYWRVGYSYCDYYPGESICSKNNKVLSSIYLNNTLPGTPLSCNAGTCFVLHLSAGSTGRLRESKPLLVLSASQLVQIAHTHPCTRPSFSLSLSSPLLFSPEAIPLRLHIYLSKPRFPIDKNPTEGGERKETKDIIDNNKSIRGEGWMDAQAVPVIADIDVSDTTGMGQTRVTCHHYHHH